MKTQLPQLPRLIGVVHLPPLAGAPSSTGLAPSLLLQEAGLQAVQEVKLLEQAGFEGVILENFGDVPFYKAEVPPETVASLSVLAAAIREVTDLPIGINVLRNDARSALAIAAVTGCDFIRVNVLSGVYATDQGMIEGEAASLMRERARLGATNVAILADAHVKHARSLSSDSLELAIEEVTLRAGADGVILTGATTGRSVSPEALEIAAQAAQNCGAPLFIGSGANLETLSELKRYAHGVIVSSALRKEGRAGAPLDPQRVRAFAKAFFASPSVKVQAKSQAKSKAKGKSSNKKSSSRRKIKKRG